MKHNPNGLILWEGASSIDGAPIVDYGQRIGPTLEDRSMTKHQGHRSWNAWNVSLWINNDEPLYRHALDLVKRYGRRHGAYVMARELAGEKTPDGASFNRTCIYEAMEGMQP